MTDPEDTVDLLPADVAEAAADLTDDSERPVPIEAPEADVAEQKAVVETDDEDYPEES